MLKKLVLVVFLLAGLTGSVQIIKKAIRDKIVVLTIHGVPDEAHPWVNTPLELFEAYLKYLHTNHYQVIALRDLRQYINPVKAMQIITPNFNKPK